MAPDLDFSGKLSFLNLGELLQLLGSGSSSGTLSISSPHTTETGTIMVEKGNPVNASAGARTGLEALYALFGWTEGRFEFRRGKPTGERTIKKGRMELILDGLRLLDEGKIPRLGPENAPSEEPDVVDLPAARSDVPPIIKGPLVDYAYVVDEESYYDGDEIVREGSHGNWIWVVLEGAAEIVKTTPAGVLRVLRVGDGAFVGSVASLLAGHNVRSSTVYASGNIQLGMLDSQLLSSELANLSPDFKALLKSLDNRLRSVTGIAAEAHAHNTAIMESLRGKKIAIKEGMSEDRLFRIREGEVVIARSAAPGYLPLARLAEGDFFGFIPFLTIGHEPYAAAVFSSPDLKLASVDSKQIENEHRRLSTTLRNIIEHLAACISATTLVTINAITAAGLGSSSDAPAAQKKASVR